MGSKYKVKKGCGCKMCKPHKGGWAPKHTEKELARRREFEKTKLGQGEPE